VCKVENIDFEKYAKETLTIGYPVLGLVHQIAHLCNGDAGKYCHWGATTQDITDSATILQIKASFDLIAKELNRAAVAPDTGFDHAKSSCALQVAAVWRQRLLAMKCLVLTSVTCALGLAAICLGTPLAVAIVGLACVCRRGDRRTTARFI
jgi:hypothetical protein